MVSRSAIELIDPVTGPVGRPFPLQNLRQAWVRPDGLVVTNQNDGTADVYDLGGNAVVERAYDVLARGWIAIVDGTAAVLQELSPTDPLDEAASVELIDLETGERTQSELTMPAAPRSPRSRHIRRRMGSGRCRSISAGAMAGRGSRRRALHGIRTWRPARVRISRSSDVR